MVDRILEALASALYTVDSSDQRIYWPYLAGALPFIVAAYLAQGIRSPLAMLRTLFAREVWWHRSTALDVQLLFVKPVIKALLFAPWLWSTHALAVRLVGALDAFRGVPEPSSLSPWTIRALYTLVLFVAWDWSRYAIHRLAHTVPAIWEIHQVHHSAEVMTPLTIYRSHPIESLLFQVRGILVTALVTGVFFHLFRTGALEYELLGVNALGFVLNTLGGNLRHSHVWVRYPRWLEHVLISPAQHQLHHSTEPAKAHGNLGAWLAVWDLMGGTLRTSDLGRPERFGLPEGVLNHSPGNLVSALVDPVKAAARRVWRRRAAVVPQG